MYAFKPTDESMSVRFPEFSAATPARSPEDRAIDVDYETDTALWYQRQLALLQSRDLGALDIPNLIDELQSMANRDKNELASRLAIVLVHLLKWQLQPEAISSGWVGTLGEQRRRLYRLIRQNPSFRRLVDELAADEYRTAVRTASLETRIHLQRFPASNPYSQEQLLDAEYFPSPIPDRFASFDPKPGA